MTPVDILVGALALFGAAVIGLATVSVRREAKRIEIRSKIEAAEAQRKIDEQTEKHAREIADIQAEQERAHAERESIRTLVEMLDKLVSAQIGSSTAIRAGFAEIKADAFQTKDAIANLASSYDESISVMEAQGASLSDFKAQYLVRNDRLVSNQVATIAMLNEIKAMIQSLEPCDKDVLLAIIQPMVDLYQTLDQQHAKATAATPA